LMIENYCAATGRALVKSKNRIHGARLAGTFVMIRCSWVRRSIMPSATIRYHLYIHRERFGTSRIRNSHPLP
jgi:hypothetical protein